MVKYGKGGKIVNISSQASLTALPLHTVYCKFFSHFNFNFTFGWLSLYFGLKESLLSQVFLKAGLTN